MDNYRIPTGPVGQDKGDDTLGSSPPEVERVLVYGGGDEVGGGADTAGGDGEGTVFLRMGLKRGDMKYNVMYYG